MVYLERPGGDPVPLAMHWLERLGFGCMRPLPPLPNKVGAIIRDARGILWVLRAPQGGAPGAGARWVPLNAREEAGGGAGVPHKGMADRAAEVVFGGVGDEL